MKIVRDVLLDTQKVRFALNIGQKTGNSLRITHDRTGDEVPLLARAAEPAPRSGGQATTPAALQRTQEINQIFLLDVCELHIETAVVEIDDLAQGLRRSVGEIRRARGQPAQLLHHDRTHVGALARNQRASRSVV